MFQVAFRRLAPKRWHHYSLIEGNRFTGPSNFRLISSFEPAYSLQPRKKHHASQLGNCRVNFSNFQIIHGGYSRSFPLLHHQRRWFSDEKPPPPPPPKKTQEEPGRLSQIVPALRQRATNFNTGDLMSVYAIAVLILVIIFSPFVARYVLDGTLSSTRRVRIVVGYIRRTSVRDSHSLTDARAIKPNEKVGQYVRGN